MGGRAGAGPKGAAYYTAGSADATQHELGSFGHGNQRQRHPGPPVMTTTRSVMHDLARPGEVDEAPFGIDVDQLDAHAVADVEPG